MEQTLKSVPAREPWFPARVAALTVADIIRLPLATISQHDHVAAAAYLMKHTGTTALIVTSAQTGQPVGIITDADVAHGVADGKDVNDVWVDAMMTSRPAVTTSTTIQDTATIMTTSHFRHLPVTGDAHLFGVVDIIDVCRALIGADEE
jgi:CBS domain-containing protein